MHVISRMAIAWKNLLVVILAYLIGHAALGQHILVSPYLQPGNASKLSKEQKVLIWQTDGSDADFTVHYKCAKESDGDWRSAKVSHVELTISNYKTRIYRAEITKIDFDNRYQYEVKANGKVIATGEFNSRTKEPTTRFAVLGDCGAGTPAQAQIAYQIYKHEPQFAVLTGDIVYTRGRIAEYLSRFFPYYLAKEASPEVGAPLLNSIPFYMTVGNHDIYGADLTAYEDGLGFFYYTDLPMNGPLTSATVPLNGSKEVVNSFKKNTGRRFPRTSNYSFDHGNVHIVCIDGNRYTNPLDPTFVDWLKNDLSTTRADWKLVAFHEPPFNSSNRHYDDQWMRLLAPTLEALDVDMVITGHVHNYQRTKPLRFKPKLDETGTRYAMSEEGRVDGIFELDTLFNGASTTASNGIIYIVSGAGGAELYDTDLNNNPELWKHEPPENWVPFTEKLISDRHSFTLIETEGKRLTLKQIDAWGEVIDEITVTK